MVCDEGYQISGLNISYCTPPGYWTSPGRCVLKDLKLYKIETTTTSRPATTTVGMVSMFVDNSFNERMADLVQHDDPSQMWGSASLTLTGPSLSVQTTDEPIESVLCGPKQKHFSPNLANAIRQSDVGTAYFELSNGADPNSQDFVTWTPLMTACWRNLSGLVEDLIICGADVNQVNNGKSSALMFAAKGKSLDSAKVLIRAGAKLNVKNSYGSTALIVAAQNRQSAIVRLLITKGADFTARDSDGLDALMWAVKSGDRDSIEALLLAGASPNVSNRVGQTPLMMSVQSGNIKAFQLLLYFGAVEYLRDANGNTVLDIAEQLGRRDIIKLLS